MRLDRDQDSKTYTLLFESSGHRIMGLSCKKNKKPHRYLQLYVRKQLFNSKNNSTMETVIQNGGFDVLKYGC